MDCMHCAREIGDDAAYCAYCGAAQREDAPAAATKRLERSTADRQVAGVCGGIAVYLGMDSAVVRILWVVLSIVPGAILFGLLAYLAAWLLIPETLRDGATPTRRRLTRSRRDVKLAGVCGGLAEHFDVDPTPVRLVWAVLTVFPGAIICGVVAYVVAWMIMPVAAMSAARPAPPAAGPPADQPANQTT